MAQKTRALEGRAQKASGVLAGLAILSLTFSIFTPSSQAQAAVCPTPTAPTEGDGSSDAPYVIDSAAKLAWISGADLEDRDNLGRVTADDDSDLQDRLGAIYRQTMETDMSGYQGTCWVSIGSLRNSLGDRVNFSGVYDGGNFAIRSFTTNNLSLFDNIRSLVVVPADSLSAQVKDLRLVGVVATNFSARGILASDISDARIENVHIEGRMILGGNNTGGFARSINGSELDRVSADLEVTTNISSGRQHFGGIARQLEWERSTEKPTTVTSAWTTGKIVAPDVENGSVRAFVGGLFGEVKNGSKIFNSWSSMDIFSGGSNQPGIGGLVGELDEGEIRYSYATGLVSGTDGVGGLVGMLDKAETAVFDSYARGSVTVTRETNSSSAGGGLIGRLNVRDSKPIGTVARTFSTGSVVLSDPSSPPIARKEDLGAWSGQSSTEAFGLSDYNVSNNFFDSSSVVPELGIARSTVDAQKKVTGRPTAQLQSFATFQEAGWAIVDGWAPFKVPDDDSAPVQGTHQVWGICSGVNGGYPFLLWQFDSNPCVASAAVATPREKRSSDAGIHLDFQASVGDLVAGSSVVIGGQGLSGGSQYSLIVRSTPQTLASGASSALGNFSGRVSMPALSAGSHTLTLTATALDGSTLTLVQSFTVAANGTISAIGSPTGSQTGGLAATGVSGLVGGTGLAGLALLLGVAMVLSARRYQHSD